jgi:hypothetical protein
MKYIIFESDPDVTENIIKSWAPMSSQKKPNGYHYWERVSQIKKGDIIYYISNTFLVAKAVAITDAVEIKHEIFYPNSTKPNQEWSDIGFGVYSSILIDFSDAKIKLASELEKKYGTLSKKDIYPFEKRIGGNIRAHQSGYCYTLSRELEEIIDILVEKSKKVTNLCDDKFTYNEILLDKKPHSYSNSTASELKINKGKYGESKVEEFFKSHNFIVENVAESRIDCADLNIIIGKSKIELEVKNVSNQTPVKHIFLSDSQIRCLVLEKTRLCIYDDDNFYLSKFDSDITLFQEILKTTNEVRKKVIEMYDGCYQVNELSILINQKILENHFQLLNPLSKQQIIEQLFK